MNAHTSPILSFLMPTPSQFRQFSSLTLIALTLMFSGCKMLSPVKDTASYYTLTSLAASSAKSRSNLVIAINRPYLPTYLDRQEHIVRAASGQTLIDSNNIWSEPLDSGIARVTAENLSILLGSSNIQPIQNFTTLDYSHLIDIKITRFEQNDTGEMVLECTWSAHVVKSKAAPTTRRFTTTVSPAIPAANRVAAMNQALFQLAQQIQKAF